MGGPKVISISGLYADDRGACLKKLTVIISNDSIGKTISIKDGKTQFTIPFEPLEKYLK